MSTPTRSTKSNSKRKRKTPSSNRSASRPSQTNSFTANKNRKGNSRKKHRLKQSFFAPALLVLRLSILIVGIGAILGTFLSIVNFNNAPPAEVNGTEAAQIQNTSDSEIYTNPPQEDTLIPLQEKLQELAAKYRQLKPGAFFIDLDNDTYLDWQGSFPFASASTIKIPVLVAFFQDVDEGKIKLDENLTMTKELIAGGSGNMQYEKPGTQFSALDTATRMIAISDNTATNMLIERMGGAEALNGRFLEWGLTDTTINNPLPDLEGTNTTSPRDLGSLLARIEKGELVSLRSRDRILEIMRKTVTDTLLPQGLEEDATIAHKTGDIRSVLGDAGIVDLPDGKRYIVAVLVKRPDNDPKAKELIQQISKTAYQHFKWYQSNSFTADNKLKVEADTTSLR